MEATPVAALRLVAHLRHDECDGQCLLSRASRKCRRRAARSANDPKPTWLVGSPKSASRGRADLASIGRECLQMTLLDLHCHFFARAERRQYRNLRQDAALDQSKAHQLPPYQNGFGRVELQVGFHQKCLCAISVEDIDLPRSVTWFERCEQYSYSSVKIRSRRSRCR